MKKLTKKEKEKLKKALEVADKYRLALEIGPRMFNRDEMIEIERKAIKILCAEKNQDEEFISDAVRGLLTERDMLEPYPMSIWGGEYVTKKAMLLVERIDKRIAGIKDVLYRKICVDFNYCEKRRNKEFQTEGFNLGLAVSDALLSAATGFPLPIALVSAYLIKNHFFDELCGYDKNSNIG